MSDVRDLQERINRAMGRSNLRLQSELVSSLLGTAREFVDSILEENSLVKSTSMLRRELEQTKQQTDEENPEKDKQISELQDTLTKARQLETGMNEKRAALRKLDTELEVLRREIRRGLGG